MPRLTEQIIVPHSADNLFLLVRDIRRYPDFIKWIGRMRVLEEAPDAEPYTCIGEAAVTFKGFEQTFSTHVRADRAAARIDVELHRGPFRHLRNRWTFEPQADDRTRIHFFIDYDFRNPVLSMLARANGRLAVNRIMAAFRAEADRRFAGTPDS
ncbi:MAG: type II toxin-antitoxin system RatA family toxin [Henriciella sp.]